MSARDLKDAADVNHCDDIEQLRAFAQGLLEERTILRAVVTKTEKQRDDLTAAAEKLLAVVRELAEHIDDEMDLDNHDKPNWAMRLGAQFGAPLGNAFNAMDAVVVRAKKDK